MRLSLIGLALMALVNLTPASATAEVGNGRFHYETCSCHFGYGSSPAAAVSCASEGGYCSALRPHRPGRSTVVLRVRG
jgi:hypothetical protein